MVNIRNRRRPALYIEFPSRSSTSRDDGKTGKTDRSGIDSHPYIGISGYMELEYASAVLAALAQPTRLAVFRLLMKAGAKGIPAGEIARMVEAPQNTVSTHLATLAHAGLAVGMRQGRMVRYRVNLDTTRDLLEYLMKDCCAGNPQVCLPLLEGMDLTSASCTPASRPEIRKTKST